MSKINDIIKDFYNNNVDDFDKEGRHYTWGSYIDLCGMAVEDAIPVSPTPGGGGGGEETGKTKNTITLSMQKNSEGNFTLRAIATSPSSSDVTILFSLNGSDYTAVIPAGATVVDTGINGEDPTKPYAVIANITVQSSDESFKYEVKNNVKTGFFTLTISNDGEISVESVKYGTEYTLPEVEPREGYSFVWKDAKGVEITGSTFTMPEENTTITGTYVASEHTLTYVINEEIFSGSSVIVNTTSGSSTVKFGVKILPLISGLTPSKEGKTLDGWKVNGVAVTSATTMPNNDIEAVNVYKLNKYSVTYLADGIEFAKADYYFGEAISVTGSTPTKTGYEFDKWDATLPATMPSHNITLNAVFTPIIYYIRYIVDGTEKYSETHHYGDAISIRPDETKEGYDFSGWNPQTLPATMPAEDIEVVGSFTINSYTLSCEVDGVKTYEKAYEYGAEVDATEIEEPVKVGYTFTSWSEAIPTTMPARDVVLVAEFEINHYSLNYYVDGALYSSVTYDYGETVIPLAEPTREGYEFSGWDNEPETVPANDVDINGTFSILSYKLTYFVDGEEYSSVTYEFGAAITPIAEPQRTGYTFSGWDIVPATMPAYDVRVDGSFTINVHELTYFVDGVQYAQFEYEYGEAISAITEPTREGYTFSGWGVVPATMPDEDVNVYGTFTVNQYTLTFNLDGAFYSSITADYGTAIIPPVEPSREGYTFSGWNPVVPATMPAENLTLSGTLNINSHVASYFIDGSSYSSVTYNYGDTIIYPDVPRSGYTLQWDKYYTTMPDADITINGTYVEIVEAKTIYYDTVLTNEEQSISGVTGMASVDCEKGTSADIPVIIPASDEYSYVEENYDDDEFDEWCLEHNYSAYIAVPTAMTFDFLNPNKQSVKNTERFYTIGAPFVVDGNEYQGYVYRLNTCCISTEQISTYTIENETPVATGEGE